MLKGFANDSLLGKSIFILEWRTVKTEPWVVAQYLYYNENKKRVFENIARLKLAIKWFFMEVEQSKCAKTWISLKLDSPSGQKMKAKKITLDDIWK